MMNNKFELLKIALTDAEYFLCQLEIARDENPDNLNLDDAILKARANIFAIKSALASLQNISAQIG